ncbi:MAG TPA: homoserine dehydrogenase [Lachnospiraceae bacterium]|nr:homoserine dehydrogenase [Lachnospiraceae bacterium]
MVQVAVFGFGTVGSGVVEVIEKNQKEISKRAATELNVKYVLDLRDFPGNPIQDKIVHDVETILGDETISIICETMGGLEPAYTYTKKALASGKSVCTSNKELVAAHGPELIALARENNCNYLFEASVGGGIPIIRPLNSALTAEKIDRVYGILNGTTNYILTRMEKDGADFETVLKEAQEKGYAERNPAADVEGYDACRKIAILSSLIYGKNVNYENIYTEGITKITPADFAYAKELDCQIKLIALNETREDGKFAMVSPRMITAESPLTCVQDVFNGILIHSNMLGSSLYYGRGAGKLPTASAVVGDVIDCAKHAGKNIWCFWEEEEETLCDIADFKQKYFVRISGLVEDKKDAVTAAFGETKFVTTKEVQGEFAVVTSEMSEREYHEAAKKIEGILSMIRM